MQIRIDELPPSVNLYTRFRVMKKGGRSIPVAYKSAKAKTWLKYATKLLRDTGEKFDGLVQVFIKVDYSNAGRDLDNFCKCTLDALTKSGVIKDDNMNNVAKITIVRGERVKRFQESLFIEVKKYD